MEQTTKPVQTAESTLANTLEVLHNSFEASPLGVMNAFDAMNGFLNDVVEDLGADPEKSPLVKRAVELRTLIGESSIKLQDAQRTDAQSVYRQTADVATAVFERIEVSPIASANKPINNTLDWVIPALENAGYGQPQTNPLTYDNPAKAVLKEAYKLKLVLDGTPDVVSELRFLITQELMISRLIGAVPATSLYGYWISLNPVTEEAKKYHEGVTRELEKLAPESWDLGIHAEANVSFWEAIAETVEANSCDAIMRVLSQQATTYIKERTESLRNHLAPCNEKWAKQAVDRACSILTNLRVHPIFPHFQLDAWALSPYPSNYENASLVNAAVTE